MPKGLLEKTLNSLDDWWKSKLELLRRVVGFRDHVGLSGARLGLWGLGFRIPLWGSGLPRNAMIAGFHAAGRGMLQGRVQEGKGDGARVVHRLM